MPSISQSIAERVDVDAPIDRLPARLLGRHVADLP
jgi:hypothetical protein